MKQIPAGQFKARCLAILDEVAEKRTPYTVTKHGKPVARIVPCPGSPAAPVNPLENSVVFQKDIVSPVEEEWEADR